jgi:hypothetical protein
LVGVSVGGPGVNVFVGVLVNVGVLVIVDVFVMVRVGEGVLVRVGVFVGVLVLVGVLVMVGVLVTVAVAVAVGVSDGVLVAEAVAVGVGVSVDVGVETSPKTTRWRKTLESTSMSPTSPMAIRMWFNPSGLSGAVHFRTSVRPFCSIGRSPAELSKNTSAFCFCAPGTVLTLTGSCTSLPTQAQFSPLTKIPMMSLKEV